MLLLLIAAVVGGGYLWVRDSSLVAVENVTVTGLTGPDAPRIRAALVSAASDMTTLHVRMDQLETAVQPFPIVRQIRVTTDKPHGMRIDVVQNAPVARLESGGDSTLIAADGTILRGLSNSGHLPAIAIDVIPGGGQVTAGPIRSALTIAAAAPKALQQLIERISTAAGEIEVKLVNGPMVIFGSDAQAKAKWAAAATVLADPAASGAALIDVRAPDRPVAGPFAPGDGVVSATPDWASGGTNP
ncbi:MAG: cell division protein FtsQ/DivIB [Solirubrobacterales bacterium]|nr:cell division protein FtsQ/DivIB [Solirubrobacterales bacterium]